MSSQVQTNKTRNTRNARNVFDEFPSNTFVFADPLNNTQDLNLERNLLDRVYFFKYEIASNTRSKQYNIDCLPLSQVTNSTDIDMNSLDNIERYETQNNGVTTTWIKFSFRNILMFGTTDQQKRFHDFRKKYLTTLLRSSCKGSCNFEIVGSDSPVSDYDVTLYEFLDNNDERLLYDVEYGIKSQHSKMFVQSLEELFDCNLYLTSFFHYSSTKEVASTFECVEQAGKSNSSYLCVPVMNEDDYDIEQRDWSLTKLGYVVFNIFKNGNQGDYAKIKSYIQTFFPNYWTRIEKSWEFYKQQHKYDKGTRVKEHKNTVRKSINMGSYNFSRSSTSSSLLNSPRTSSAGNNSNNNNNNNNTSLSRSSSIGVIKAAARLSITEKDTYSTIGASFAHVINHKLYPTIKDRIYPAMYIDAMLDNLGFISNLVIKSDACFSKTFMLVKIAKYLDRICTDYKDMRTKTKITNTSINQSDAEQIAQIHMTSATINDNRKKLKSLVEYESDVYSLENQLKNYFSVVQRHCENRNGSCNIPKINNSLITGDSNQLLDILLYITVFVFDIIYDFDEHKGTNIQGGAKRKAKKKTNVKPRKVK